MLKNTLIAAMLGATTLTPMTAGSYAGLEGAELVLTPLGMAIAAQGNQALKTIRREARVCLRSLKPAPLETLIQPVNRAVAPTEVAAGQLAL